MRLSLSVIYLFVGVAIATFVGCKGKGGAAKADELAALEKRMLLNFEGAAKDTMYRALTEFVAKHPNDANTPHYLYTLARIKYYVRDYAQVTKLLEELTAKHKTSADAPKGAMMLANLYQNDFKDEAKAKQWYQFYIDNYPNGEAIADAKAYFMPERERLIHYTNVYMKGLINPDDPRGRIAKDTASRLVTYYVEFASKFPTDTLSDKYLFKAAEIANSIQDYNKALEIWDKLYTTYPSSAKAPSALFMQGFVNENNLKDLDKAKGFYKTFLSKYPKNELAKSVEFSLKYLGQSPEVIVKEFEKNKEGTK